MKSSAISGLTRGDHDAAALPACDTPHGAVGLRGTALQGNLHCGRLLVGGRSLGARAVRLPPPPSLPSGLSCCWADDRWGRELRAFSPPLSPSLPSPSGLSRCWVAAEAPLGGERLQRRAPCRHCFLDGRGGVSGRELHGLESPFRGPAQSAPAPGLPLPRGRAIPVAGDAPPWGNRALWGHRNPRGWYPSMYLVHRGVPVPLRSPPRGCTPKHSSPQEHQ